MLVDCGLWQMCCLLQQQIVHYLQIFRGDRGTVEHGVQWDFCNIFIEYAIGLVIFLYSDILQCLVEVVKD